MNNKYRRIAELAISIVKKSGINPADADPMKVLNGLRNVLVLSSKAEYMTVCQLCELVSLEENQGAISLVNRKNGRLQYIVVHDQDAPRISLARELGHVLLEHEGNTQREVDEAMCFAHHFICPMPLLYPFNRKKVQYRPIRKSLSSEFKDARVFESIESMKVYVADERNRYNNYIGKTTHYAADDVELTGGLEFDSLTGWKSCYSVVLDGSTVGYCGE